MSEDLFEVAFSGQVSEATDLDNIKARVGKMFNANDAKIAQLFSGKRIVIKKNVDRTTADKYRNAFKNAGAIAEVELISEAAVIISPVEVAEKPGEVAKSAAIPQVQPVERSTSSSTDDAESLNPPRTDPLGITGDQIEDLAATIAPVGSAMQDKVKEVEAPAYDLSGLDVAPVGSQLGVAKKEADPLPPDTSGLSMAD